jgi:hypothetical protein
MIRMTISRWVGWSGYVARMGEISKEYKISISKLEEKRSLGKPENERDDDNAKGLWEIVSEMWPGFICLRFALVNMVGLRNVQ